MPYLYQCDGFCDADGEEPRDGRPPFTGEFNEDWYDNTRYGDQLRQHGYEPGDLITLCPECTRELLLDH
jgi:hypothetical protein